MESKMGRDIKEKISSAYQNIKLWSSGNQAAKEVLHPDLGLRDWDTLTKEDKRKIWKHLMPLWYKKFENNPKRISFSVETLNDRNKYHSFAKEYLSSPSNENAYHDFQNIFYTESQHVVFELLSYYLTHVLYEKEHYSYEIYQQQDEPSDNFEKRFTKWLYNIYDSVIKLINDTFEQFGLNVCATRQGFIPRQEQKIMTQIYEPVLSVLSSQKWEPVNRELKDAFSDFMKKTEESYSSCVTHAISALEAFMQILNDKPVGKGKLSDLIKVSYKKELIPKDIFTENIFKNIESIIMRTRQETSDAHPKKEYATEKNSRLILNLVMIFIQHCLQI